MKKLTFSLILAAACFLFGNAQDESTIKEFASKYDAYIKQLTGKIPEIPAIAVVVIKNDKPVFLQAYGVADKETGTKADINTLFYIASSTKSFTALAAALLDKEDKIKLNDPVKKYSKGIDFSNSIPEKITVRDLLTHTSGLQNDPLTFRLAYSGEVDTKDINRVFAEATVYVDSNYNKYKYDNLGYNIYGILLKQSLEKKWQDVLQEKIFTPMKMEHTTAYVSKAIDNKWKIAYPYMYTAERGVTRTWLEKKDNNMQSAGGVFASIADIGAWLNMNMNEGKLNGKQIFPADIIRKCQTGYTKTERESAPFIGDGEYGLGWQIGKYKNEKVIYHHGGFPGYRSHISFLPDKKIAVAVLINDGSIGVRAGHLLATYAYDWLVQVENIDALYAKQLQDLLTTYDNGKKSLQAGLAERAKRTSQLSLPLESYTGKFRSSDFGTMEIFLKDNALAARLGNMQTVSTPFTEKETVRVELIPGSGQVLRFKKNNDNKIESVALDGVEFRKMN